MAGDATPTPPADRHAGNGDGASPNSADPAVELVLEAVPGSPRSSIVRPIGFELTAPGSRGTRWTVQAAGDSRSVSFDPDAAPELRTAAAAAGVESGQLRALIDRVARRRTAPGGASAPFALRLRPRYCSEPLSVEDGPPTELLREELSRDRDERDLELEWGGYEYAVALDIDPLGGMAGVRGLCRPEIEDMFPDWLPRPLAAGPTHNGGLRAVFTPAGGMPASALAGAWLMLAPLGRADDWTSQAKTRMAHPFSPRGGRRCDRNAWCFYEPSAWMVVPRHRRRVEPSVSDVQQWLSEQGAHVGGRLRSTPCCERAGNRAGEVRPGGVHCYRCQRFWSWAAILTADFADDAPSTVHDAAKAWVHWAHQRHVLSGLYRDVPEVLGPLAWRLMLAVVHGAVDNDDRARELAEPLAAATRAEGLVRVVGQAWADRHLRVLDSKITESTAWAIPWTFGDPFRVERVRGAGRLDGFRPIRPHPFGLLLSPYELALHAEKAPEEIARRMTRGTGELAPPEVGADRPSPQDIEQAHGDFAARFPGWSLIHTSALRALLLAAIDARHAMKTPPLVIVGGPTGSGKTILARLAAHAIGGTIEKVASFEPADLTRGIGLALQAGASVIHLDEIGHKGGWKAMGVLLDAGPTWTFAAKYANEATVPMTAALVVTGSEIPGAFTAGEVGRRGVRVDLPSLRGVDWLESGDLSRARNDPTLAEALRVLVADSWHAIRDTSAGRWRTLALALDGVEAPTEGADGDSLLSRDRAPLYRCLYQLYREMPDTHLRADGDRRSWWVPLRGGSMTMGPAYEGRQHLSELLGIDLVPRLERDDRARLVARCREIARSPLNQLLGLPAGTPDTYLKFDNRSGPPRAWRFTQLGIPKDRHPGRAEMPEPSVDDARPMGGDASADAPQAEGPQAGISGVASDAPARSPLNGREGGSVEPGRAEHPHHRRCRLEPGATPPSRLGASPGAGAMACASPAARVNERGFGVDVALVNLVAAHGPHEPHVRAGLRSLGSSPGDDGRVRGAFTARNTVSGRYTAGAWHSLPRTSLSEEAVEEILAANALPEGLAAEELLRPCVVPRAGYVFVQADWKQAQARIVAAELGEAWPEGDPYVAAAARLGLEGRGARAFGKLLQLSLQFGMGAAELANKAAEMGVDWEAIGLTPAEAIAAHRRERPDLVRLWKALPARTIADGRARRLSLWSGRELVYPNAIANGDGVVYTGRHGQREQAWGGALLAHFAQGVEVDLLDDAIERLEAAGLPVVFHMHDGLVVEVPEHAGPHALSTVEEVMTSPPDWATDRRLRLNVAAQLRTRFGSV